MNPHQPTSTYNRIKRKTINHMTKDPWQFLFLCLKYLMNEYEMYGIWTLVINIILDNKNQPVTLMKQTNLEGDYVDAFVRNTGLGSYVGSHDYNK